MSDADLSVLNSRIDKIEVTLSHAVDAIEKIASVVNDSKKTDWGVISSWVSILLAIGVAVYVPIADKMANNKDDIKSLETEVLDMQSNGWSHSDHQEYKEEVNNRINRLEDGFRDEADRLADQIDEIRRDLYNNVPVQQGN